MDHIEGDNILVSVCSCYGSRYSNHDNYTSGELGCGCKCYLLTNTVNAKRVDETKFTEIFFI